MIRLPALGFSFHTDSPSYRLDILIIAEKVRKGKRELNMDIMSKFVCINTCKKRFCQHHLQFLKEFCEKTDRILN